MTLGKLFFWKEEGEPGREREGKRRRRGREEEGEGGGGPTYQQTDGRVYMEVTLSITFW